MAPRRGGGGGGGGSASIRCSSYAFSDYYSRVLIAFIALFCVFYIVLAFFIPGTKKRRALNGGQPPRNNGRWVTLGWCISLEIIAVILWATWYIMQQCGASTFDPVATAQYWIAAIALLCLWGVILIPACKALHELSGSLMPKFVTIGHSVFFGWLVLLKLVWLSLITAARHADFGFYDFPDDLATATNAMYVTRTVFGLIGMLMASASMIQALSRSAQLKAGSLKLRVYTLSFASIGYSVIDLAFFVYFTYTGPKFATTTSEIKNMIDTSLASTFLGNFFFGFMFISAVFVLRDPRVMSGSATPPTDAFPAAPNPVEQQQQQNMQQYPTGYHSVPVYDPNQGANYQNYQSYPGQPPQGPTYYQH